MGRHRSRMQCWHSQLEDYAVSCCHENGSPGLPLGWLWGNPERTMLHTPIFLMSVPNIFHGWNGNTQLSRTRNIDNAVRLFQINDLVMFDCACSSQFRPGLHKPWYVVLKLTVTHLKLNFRLHNVCHCFVSLDRNDVWQVINFSIYWKLSILCNVLPKIQIFPQNISHGKMKLKMRPITFNQPCTCM